MSDNETQEGHSEAPNTPEGQVAPTQAPEAARVDESATSGASEASRPTGAALEEPWEPSVAVESKPKQGKDRVAMVSLRADGSPDQADSYLVIGDDEDE